MANARGRPNLIELTGLGGKVLSLRKTGMTLPEISRSILEDNNVNLTVNVLSRYIRKHDKDMFSDVDSSDRLKNIVSTFDAVDFYFDKIESIKAHERRAIVNRLKSARYTILDDVKFIMQEYPLTDDRHDVNQYILALSNNLCSRCREVIAVGIMNREEINVFLSNYEKAKEDHISLGDWEESYKKSWQHKRDLIKEFHGK